MVWKLGEVAADKPQLTLKEFSQALKTLGTENILGGQTCRSHVPMRQTRKWTQLSRGIAAGLFSFISLSLGW